MTTAAHATVDALVSAGVEVAFGVPGESYLGILDALRDSPIEVVATRHEGGAAFMAEAYAKLTRRLTVCMATRAVGAANLAIGLHTAHQDSSPVFAVVGQVAVPFRSREAFQEINLEQFLGPVTKQTVEVVDPARCGPTTAMLAAVASSGRPGPVAVAYPEDVLGVEVEYARSGPQVSPRPSVDEKAVRRVVSELRSARRPLILAGLGVLAAQATDALVRFALLEQVPVATAWRRPDAFPNDHELYLGQLGIASPPSIRERLEDTDLLVVIGSRLNEITTFHFDLPSGMRLVHVDIAQDTLARTTAADAVLADARQFLDSAIEVALREPAEDTALAVRRSGNASDRAKYESETAPGRGRAAAGYVDQQQVAGVLRERLSARTVITTDAGNFAGWPARYYRWRHPRTFLGPTSGAMGYAVPAAIAAKLASPECPVVALAGDGGFLMTATELETATRVGTGFVSIVYDNEQYGTIKGFQEAAFPGRQIGTALGPTRLADLASSLGGAGFTVSDLGDFCAALEEAEQIAASERRPAVIVVRCDPGQMSVDTDQR